MTRDRWRATVIVLDPSDTPAATAERRRILYEARAYSWADVRPHGTLAAYRRHLRCGEEPCESCRQALKREAYDRCYVRHTCHHGGPRPHQEVTTP